MSIAEEIDMYRDAPDEAIFEDFDDKIFPGHSWVNPFWERKTVFEALPKISWYATSIRDTQLAI